MTMKKINWLIALLSVFSLTFAACGGDEVDDKKPQPKPQPPVEQSFDIQIDEVTFNSVDFTVTPTDLEADYLCMLYDAETVEYFRNDKMLISALVQEIEEEASYKGMTYEQYMPEFLDRGVLVAQTKPLTPETDYYILVLGIDAANGYKHNTALFKKEFTTEAAPVMEVTFEVESTVKDTTAQIKVTPSDSKAIWYYSLMSSAQYTGLLEAGYTPEAIIEVLYGDDLNRVLADGKSIYEAVNATFHIGPKSFNVSNLVYNTEYTNVVAGFIIDQDANITLATPVNVSTFATGDLGEVDMTFEITVENIGAKSASVKVVPSDLTQTFNWQVGQWDGVSTAEEIMATIMPYGLYTGVQDYPNFSLEAPDTYYYVIAYGYAHGAGVTTAPVMKTFRSAEAPSAEETTFDVTLNSSSTTPYSFAFNISASHDTTYYSVGIAIDGTFKSDAIVNEINTAIADYVASYRENYDPNYTVARALSALGFYRGNFDNVNVSDLTPDTTYMIYILAIDIKTGLVAKVHTFENFATTKALSDVVPEVEYVKYFSGREENGAVYGKPLVTENKAIILVKYKGLENARSLFDYICEDDITNIIDYPDSMMWSLIPTGEDGWLSVSVKKPYSLFVVDWEMYNTIFSYAVDKRTGCQGALHRELTYATVKKVSPISELLEVVAELNATAQSAVRYSVPQSLVVEE